MPAKRQRKNLFNVDYLDGQLGKPPLNTLFEQTKEAYEGDKIFDDDEEIRLRPATCREIVKLRNAGRLLSGTLIDLTGIRKKDIEEEKKAETV